MMRTSYNAVDWLDCSPMDEFQKDFFLYRQQEWDKYRSDHANIMQGDLADASYFDFISFADEFSSGLGFEGKDHQQRKQHNL